MEQQVQEILENQQEIGKRITKMYERFNKEGRVRRNKLERLNQWRSDINEEWIWFLENHDPLTEREAELKNEVYFKEDYYNFIKLFHDDMMTKINLQESLEKRKLGQMPGTKEDPPTSDKQEEDEIEEGDQEDAGFVTTMGDILSQSHSTPKSTRKKPENDDDPIRMEKITQFITLEKNISRKLNEIESLAMDGLKIRARIVLNDLSNDWKKINEELDKVCMLTGEHEQKYYETKKSKPSSKYRTKPCTNNRHSTNEIRAIENSKVQGHL